MRLSELAETVELDLSTVSRQMRDLVAIGLVRKVPDPDDGRASLLSLSERGRAVLDAVSLARQQALAEVIDDWSDDQRTALDPGPVPPRGGTPPDERDERTEHPRAAGPGCGAVSIDTPSRPVQPAAPAPEDGPDLPSGSMPALSHRQILIVFSGLMIGMFLAALDQTIVGTALPTIVNSLHGLNHISWVVTAYLLTSTISTPLYGKLSDQFGRKGLFQFAIVIFLVGSALAGLSQSMAELIAFRGIQGLGAGGLMALAMTIIADVVSPRERGRYQGYFGATFALVVGGRAAARRRVHRQPELAVDLLHQHPHRHRGPGGHLGGAQAPLPPAGPPDRLPGGRPCWSG